ncbi:2-keto-4-pentenoate hydratase [Sphingobium phenoxybenzoativorans]|uniref:4-oxalocrotonate decarboxylase n=1 Tax=Sphingobium phenoxybenzoativorans TaxID=1592790 RepID=A0A1W5YR28_9SPHN|nr:fumarylacetoacetate hydrolase family protein [Sphingobium phenoxybenzoativorans]ARI47614.1 4-oxalocrotonate decarboxylase [Sphingobium phenoxybenzoativorans]
MAIDDLARTVDEAARTATEITQLAESHSLTVDEAYAIQALSMRQRFERGEKLIGMKMGLTSRAKMQQMGVSDVIWGRLTDAMRVEDGDAIEFEKFVHPRVEPEIAFILKRPLEGRVTLLEAMNAIEAVAPAMEIIDSRYRNFKFSLPDVIADNSSSSAFVLGPWNSPSTDISNLGMAMQINGRAVQIGSSAAILGHPGRSLAAASRLVAASGLRLEAGWIIMAGGATAAEKLLPGMAVRLDVERIGRTAFSVSSRAA